MGCSKSKKQKQSPGAKLAAETAREQYGYYKQNVIPIENYDIGEMNRQGGDLKRNQSVERTLNSAKSRMGVTKARINPASGAYKGNIVANEVGRGQAKASAAVTGDQVNEDRYYQKKVNTLARGRGVSTSGSAITQRSASFGAANASVNARAANQNKELMMSAIGQAAGYGMGSYSNKGPSMKTTKPDQFTYNDQGNAGINFAGSVA